MKRKKGAGGKAIHDNRSTQLLLGEEAKNPLTTLAKWSAMMRVPRSFGCSPCNWMGGGGGGEVRVSDCVVDVFVRRERGIE